MNRRITPTHGLDPLDQHVLAQLVDAAHDVAQHLDALHQALALAKAVRCHTGIQMGDGG